MSAWWSAHGAGIGRRWTWAALAAVLVGVAALVTGLGAADAPRTLGALMASWIFFAGLAAGALAFRAFFRIVTAGWARALSALAVRQLGFAPVAVATLAVILAGARLAPWLGPEADSPWLGATALTLRELVLTTALFVLAFLALRPTPETERPARAPAVGYLAAFAVVVSIWAFDFVLGPDPVFQSTLIGPFVFMGAFLGGTDLLALLAVTRGELADGERRDVAGLILALTIFWAYLFWSQYLTIWYGNLPDEIEFALTRAAGGWGPVVLAVIALVFAVPFLTLLHPIGRRSPVALRALLAVQLLGLWLTCHLLVVPSLAAPGSAAIGARDVLVALGMLGAFVLATTRRSPDPARQSV